MMLDGTPLDKITINPSKDISFEDYPFNISLIQNLKQIVFKKQVTFFVGENGSGKSTILEALAEKIGLGKSGSKNLSMLYDTEKSDVKILSDSMNLSWRIKVDGYFFRAESFWDVANKLDQISKEVGGSGAFLSYGGKNLHHMSHGEGFLAFFKNRIGGGGIYILDEPEAALSPQRQLALLSIIHNLCKNQKSQFIIATHSPILLSYPNSQILSCDEDNLKEVSCEETNHYQITKSFLNNPNQYLRHLFD